MVVWAVYRTDEVRPAMLVELFATEALARGWFRRVLGGEPDGDGRRGRHFLRPRRVVIDEPLAGELRTK